MDRFRIGGQPVAQWVSSRPFESFCLILTASCSAAWLLKPQASAVWLSLIVLPWLLRFLFTKKLFKRTPFDIWLILFIFTAIIGIWTAYNRQDAWGKFFTLAGAVAVFYIISWQPRKNIWWVGWGISLLGCVLALAFLFSDNFQMQIADLTVITQANAFWSKIRPFSFALPLQHNTVGGILGVLLPIQIAVGITAGKQKQTIPTILAAGVAIISTTVLALTSSRGAWLALMAAGALALLWQVSSIIKNRMPGKFSKLGRATIALAMTALLVIFIQRSGGFEKLVDYLPGADTGGIRLEIARNTLWLVDDYLLTGGGLGSFPGLYSRYMLLIPFFAYGYSHNMFLDIALEQGLFGLIAFCAILLITAWRLLTSLPNRNEETGIFQLALVISLGAMVFHGCVDDAFYGQQGTPLLFMISGIATFFSNDQSGYIPKLNPVHIRSWIGLLTGICLILAVVRAKPLLSRIAANLGSIAMSRAELAHWPEDLNKVGANRKAVDNISGYFNQALQWDPSNRTARYRLGLIALDKGDYNIAVELLKSAYSQSPGHRGIRKILGYAYTWQGQLPAAMQLLAQFPEVKDELSAYAWWWQTQNHQDLSVLASRLGQLLP